VLLRAVDAIPDVFKTVVNVTGDLAIAVLAHRVVGDAAPGVGVTPGVAA
jgi:Na+/H+-dicarboxylate symporter